MATTFRIALQAACDANGVSLRKVAAETGVSYEQLKKLLQREDARTNVDDAVKVANFFGMTLDEFIGDTTASDRREVVALYLQLSDAERQLLRDAARGRRDQDPAATK